MVVLRLIGFQGDTIWIAKDKKVVSLSNLTDPLQKQLPKVLEKLGGGALATAEVYAVGSKAAATKWKGPPDTLALCAIPIDSAQGLAANGIKDNGDFLFVNVEGAALPAWAAAGDTAATAPSTPLATPRTPRTPGTARGGPPPPPPPPPAVAKKAPPPSPQTPASAAKRFPPTPADDVRRGGPPPPSPRTPGPVGARPPHPSVEELQRQELERIALRNKQRAERPRPTPINANDSDVAPGMLAGLPSPPRKLAQPPRRPPVEFASSADGGLSSADDDSNATEEDFHDVRFGRRPMQQRVTRDADAATQREVLAMREALHDMRRQLEGEKARARQNEELKAAVKTLAANAAAAEEREAGLEAQVRAAEAKAAETAALLGTRDEEVASLRAQLDDAHAAAAAAKAAGDAAAAALQGDVDRDRVAMAEKVAVADAAAAAALAARDETAETLRETEDELRELRAWADEMHSYATSQEGVADAAAQAEERAAALAQQVESLEGEAARLRLQVTAKAREVTNLTASLQASQALLAKAKAPPPPPPAASALQAVSPRVQRRVADAVVPGEACGRQLVVQQEARAWRSLQAFATPLRWAMEQETITPQAILAWRQPAEAMLG